MDRGDAALVGEPNAGPHRLEVLLVGPDHVPLLEPPRGLLAQHAGRLAGRVALDHAALDVEVASRQRQRSRVEPDRVVVLGDHRRREVARELVELPAGRLAMRPPVAAPPPVAAQPAPALGARCRAKALECLVERRAAVQLHLALCQGPGGEVDVGVREARHDDAAAQVDHLRGGECGLVDADAARDPFTCDRQRPLGRHLRVERADEGVLENHPGRRIARCSAGVRTSAGG